MWRKNEVDDIHKVVEEMIEKGWSHPCAGTIVCNKLKPKFKMYCWSVFK